VEYLSILDAAIINLRKSELFTTVIPSKIFETSAMQIPILLGVDGEARSIVEKFNAGLYYEPENIESFITTLSTLFSNDLLFEDHKAGCKILAQEFNRERLAFEMLTIIKKTSNQ
jgi:glycosyltransferase involved in cell wall biosynthesis